MVNFMDKNQKSAFSKVSMLWHFLKGCKTYFAISIFAAFFLTAIDMLIPQVISLTVDAVLGNDPGALSDFSAMILEKIGGADAVKKALYLPALAIAILAIFNALGKYVNMFFTRVNNGVCYIDFLYSFDLDNYT